MWNQVSGKSVYIPGKAIVLPRGYRSFHLYRLLRNAISLTYKCILKVSILVAKIAELIYYLTGFVSTDQDACNIFI